MTFENIKQQLKDMGIYQSNKYAQRLLSDGKATRGTSYSGYIYGSHNGGKNQIIYLDADGRVQTMPWMTPHRAKQILSKWDSLDTINPVILKNYITGGYNSRRGLCESRYSQEALKRMSTIAASHNGDINLGHLTSNEAHQYRKSLRNA